MENVTADDVDGHMKREEAELLKIEMHLGTFIQYRPAPAVLDTV